MEMIGSERIAAPRDQVYVALNDPEILKASIPGCESLEKTSDTKMEATVTTKIGPVKARFQGAVTLSDLDPPRGYSITGEGKGGAAGFAKGGAKVQLEADGEETVLHYEVKVDVGGKLAQLGSRLIDGTAKKLSSEFFCRFAEIVGEGRRVESPFVGEAAAEWKPTITRPPAAAAKAAGPNMTVFAGFAIALAVVVGYMLIAS